MHVNYLLLYFTAAAIDKALKVVEARTSDSSVHDLPPTLRLTAPMWGQPNAVPDEF
jgi:hypothetical protein